MPFRFLLFGIAGLGGMLLHVAVLGGLFLGRGLAFLPAQAAATFSAMVVNYAINNWFTFRDRRRKGWGILWGLVSFCLACSVGALANLAIAEVLYSRGVAWYLAGGLGTLVGAVWNFSITSLFTWRDRKQTAERRSETAEDAAAAIWQELCADPQSESFASLARAVDQAGGPVAVPDRVRPTSADRVGH